MPEIADGLVEISGVAREPGYRSKIAVVSHADGVDPVGACVGPRGSRVRMVVSELRGEKIDIIPYNDEPARFVAKALSPARVREVLVDDEAKQATVIVPDDQLSLAIGREGQNARLAARLTGWRIDIRSETEFATSERGGRRLRARRTSAGAARRSTATGAAARTPRCRARATAACRRTRRSSRAKEIRSACDVARRSPAAATSGGHHDERRSSGDRRAKAHSNLRGLPLGGPAVGPASASLPWTAASSRTRPPACPDGARGCIRTQDCFDLAVSRRAFNRAFRAPVTVAPDTVDLVHTWQRSASTS